MCSKIVDFTNEDFDTDILASMLHGLSDLLSDIVGKTITEADAKIAIFTCSDKDSVIRNGEQPLFINGLHDGVEIQRAVDMFKTIKQKEQQRLNNTNLLEVPNGNGSKCCIVQ